MSFGPAGQVHLAGRDHRGHAAVACIAVDPAELVLARRPVAEHRMHVAVDQPRRHAGAARVDHGVGAARCRVLLAADRGDAAVLHHDGVGVEDRPVDVARQQQPDVADDHLAGLAGRDCLCHDVLPRAREIGCGDGGR